MQKKRIAGALKLASEAATPPPPPLATYGLFDGTDDYVHANGAYMPDFSESMEFEIALRGPGGISGDYFCSWGSSASNTPMFALTTGTAGNEGKARLFLRNDAATIVVNALTTADVFDGTDHIVRVTWDGVDTFQAYVDDSLDINVSPGAPGTTTLNRFAMGALLRATAGNFSQGRIGDVKITANDVLLHQWTYDDGSGTLVTDSVGAADGTAVGGMTWGP